MTLRIEVSPRSGSEDPSAKALADKARRRGYKVEKARLASVSLFDETWTPETTRRIADEILCDPVSEQAVIGPPTQEPGWVKCHIFTLPGVMNPSALSLAKAIRDLGLTLRHEPRMGVVVSFAGISKEEASRLAAEILYNPVVEGCHIDLTQDSALGTPKESTFHLATIPIRNLDAGALVALSREKSLALDAAEMTAIQTHFRALDRDPTDAEIETLAQTWSEHCCHKTFTAQVDMGGRRIDNVLKATIAASTHKLAKPWCVSVFKDNAGVIDFDGEDGITFKVETHNHPSAIEPYGGAGTGLGGCIRDTLGTGCGARPIANTDVFCFPPPAMNPVPASVIPPRRLIEGVVSGVRDYGNKMGIPTVNGAVCFDERYVGNPLVYCGSLGIIPLKFVNKKVHQGDLIVAIGGRTGRDGIHGATFSSLELTSESQAVSSGAVQIGNPITEKMLMEVLLKARDAGLIRAVTDCGAGGFSSAVGEMGAEIGADVHLDRAPLKYPGLSHWEVWISEAQERMVLAIAPPSEKAFLDLCADEDVEAVILGTFGNPDKRLRLHWKGQIVADLDTHFLHEGRPRNTRQAELPSYERKRGSLTGLKPSEALSRILEHPNVASKEWIIRQYDHEVQGNTVLKPLVGPLADGPSDAAIIAPKPGSHRAVAVACGINPQYGKIDPHAMTLAAVDEALRNIASVGAPLDRCAILDNFSWGNTKTPQGLGTLVRSAEACHDAAMGFGTPFVSGKDSLNNEFRDGDKTIVIPDTLLISAFAVMPDYRQAVTMDL
ncbi:MAG: AIR synthase related protein, partial [Planctomycetota bacterium]